MIKALFSVTALLSTIPTFHLSAQDYRAQAIRILSTVPLIDGHNDIPDAIRERGGLDSVNFAVRQPKLMTDTPRLRAGHVGGQFWAAYVPVTTMDSGTHAATYALEQIDLVHRRRRRAQLCRRQGLLPDRHRGRPRDRELARRAPHVLQARHALHHADALAQPRLGDRVHRYRPARAVDLRQAGRAGDESSGHAGGFVARERPDHVRRAAYLARAGHLLTFLGARARQSRAQRARFDSQARNGE